MNAIKKYGITFWMAPRKDLFLKSLILSCWDLPLPFPIPIFFSITDFLPAGGISHLRSTTPPPDGLSHSSFGLLRRLLTTVDSLLPPPDSEPTSANFFKSWSEDFLGTCWTLPLTPSEEESMVLEREREREKRRESGDRVRNWEYGFRIIKGEIKPLGLVNE